jgi:hypothetical protein
MLPLVRHHAACGLPPIRLHDLRHGACSLQLAPARRRRPDRSRPTDPRTRPTYHHPPFRNAEKLFGITV